MIFAQRQITLEAKPRGFHLITAEVLSQLPEVHAVRVGILHLFVKHTSAALTLNENADPTVRSDMEHYFAGLVPEGGRHYEHDTEGDDDMPAHIKSSILGSSIVIPLTMGRPNLGTWQGIYLCELRNDGGSRELVATIWGEDR